MMIRATRPGGRVVVLDYHLRMSRTPEPPATMRTFHAAFLRWRAAAGLDNEIADHLAAMFTSVGLRDVVEIPQVEATSTDQTYAEKCLGVFAEDSLKNHRGELNDSCENLQSPLRTQIFLHRLDAM